MLRRRGNAIRDNEMTEILTYHNIANSMIDPWETSPSFFESEMEWLVEQGYRGTSLKEFCKDVEQEKAVVLTFDDGYQDFFDVAMPILDRLNFKATIFIVSSLVGYISCWRTKDLRPPLLNWNEIQSISDAGYEIGSHGAYHPNFFHLSKENLEQEIMGSKETIEEKLGIPIIPFSYPWDRCNEQILNLVKEAGYKYACIHNRKCKTDFKNDCFRLRRRGMSHRISVKNFIDK